MKPFVHIHTPLLEAGRTVRTSERDGSSAVETNAGHLAVGASVSSSPFSEQALDRGVSGVADLHETLTTAHATSRGLPESDEIRSGAPSRSTYLNEHASSDRIVWAGGTPFDAHTGKPLPNAGAVARQQEAKLETYAREQITAQEKKSKK